MFIYVVKNLNQTSSPNRVDAQEICVPNLNEECISHPGDNKFAGQRNASNGGGDTDPPNCHLTTLFDVLEAVA